MMSQHQLIGEQGSTQIEEDIQTVSPVTWNMRVVTGLNLALLS